jgi:hypothetical protein
MTNTIPIKEVIVEWHFEPKDYFEERMLIEYNDFNIIIDSGHAEAKVPAKYFNSIDDLIGKLNKDIESLFLAVQVVSHQKYKLSEPERYDLREDGGKNIYVQVGSFVSVSSLTPFDFLIKDANGNIIRSSKQERIDEKKWFAETVAKYRACDKVLEQMLKSYSASVSDPKGELIHLYEIRDAVCVKFGSKEKAKKALNIFNNDWQFLGDLANREPLIQGRHRGRNPSELREATREELSKARAIAKKIIKHYMEFLEKHSEL